MANKYVCKGRAKSEGAVVVAAESRRSDLIRTVEGSSPSRWLEWTIDMFELLGIPGGCGKDAMGAQWWWPTGSLELVRA